MTPSSASFASFGMTEIVLDRVHLSYPLLGGSYDARARGRRLHGAGAIVNQTQTRARSIMALNDISLRFKTGDRVGLLGRNGSGKSTLLRVLAGIYEPPVGFVRVTGRIGSLLSVGLGMRPEATGLQNIRFAMLLAGLNDAEIRQKTDDIIAFSELGQYLEMPLRTYSNGMAMRLKFACATALSPDILLMDEWLGAGDPNFQRKATARLRQLLDRAGILVLATHNHANIKNLCNKAVWLDQGEVRAFGPVDEVLYLHDKKLNQTS